MARIYLSLGFLSYLAMLASHFDWFWGLASAYPESSPNHAVLSFYNLNIVMLYQTVGENEKGVSRGFEELS